MSTRALDRLHAHAQADQPDRATHDRVLERLLVLIDEEAGFGQVMDLAAGAAVIPEGLSDISPVESATATGHAGMRSVDGLRPSPFPQAPLRYLLAAVAAAALIIGISVGTWDHRGSGTAPSPATHPGSLYGPPGYRFRASFPGKVSCLIGPFETHVCSSDVAGVHVFSVTVSKIDALPPARRVTNPLAETHGKTVTYGQVHGVESPSPSCQQVGEGLNTEQECTADLLATDGKTVWDVVTTEFSKSNVVQPEIQFLGSFRPLGG
jgi:hypothetical protein